MDLLGKMRQPAESAALAAMRKQTEERFTRIVGPKHGPMLARLNELVDIPALSRVAPVAKSGKNESRAEKEDDRNKPK